MLIQLDSIVEQSDVIHKSVALYETKKLIVQILSKEKQFSNIFRCELQFKIISIEKNPIRSSSSCSKFCTQEKDDPQRVNQEYLFDPSFLPLSDEKICIS